MNCGFELVKKYKDEKIKMPARATEDSAGYDLAAIEDYIIPSYPSLLHILTDECDDITTPKSLEEMASITKVTRAKPSLVSTGLKCKLPKGYYLKVVARSSTPLKHWLIVANSEGIIDGDYYSNPDNDGEIMIELINLSPFPILIKKGERIAQGIITPYGKTDDDISSAKRLGGHGSTGN